MWRFLLFFSLIVMSSVWIWVGLLIPAQLPTALSSIFAVAFGLAAVALVIVIFGIRRLQWGSRFSQWIEAYFFSFLGFNSFLFVWAVVAALLIVAGVDPVEAARGCLLAALGLMFVAMFFALRGPRLVTVGEAKENSLKVVQISDLHIGATIGSRYVARVVDLALQAKPDLIVLTGDIGDGDPQTHPKSMRELARLQAPFGVVGVLGNHEHYRGAGKWVEALTQAGVKMLLNESHAFVWQGENILVHGLEASQGNELKVPNAHIVLSHYPAHATAAAQAGAKLFLAGHTHGGQFWPWTLVIGFFHRYSRGLYEVNGTRVYVSPGTGYWGPPMRLGALAEVTLLRY